MARTWPLRLGAQFVSAPVVRLYESRWVRATVEEPGPAFAGRAVVKLPPTKTVLPTISWSHATPLIWAVGRESAETVAGVEASGGAVSATAGTGALVMPTVVTASASATASVAGRNRVDRGLDMGCLDRSTRRGGRRNWRQRSPEP